MQLIEKQNKTIQTLSKLPEITDSNMAAFFHPPLPLSEQDFSNVKLEVH